MKIRRATSQDIPALVGMLADDPLGSTREQPGDPAYEKAFEVIDADPHQYLAVADDNGEVVGTLQLTFTSGLSRRGMTRATIEAVRVREDHRGEGLGERLMKWAIDEARRREAGLVQLTTDRSREDAHRFYERLGFVPSHVGMKLTL